MFRSRLIGVADVLGMSRWSLKITDFTNEHGLRQIRLHLAMMGGEDFNSQNKTMIANLEKKLDLYMRQIALETVEISLGLYRRTKQPTFLEYAKWFGQQSAGIKKRITTHDYSVPPTMFRN